MCRRSSCSTSNGTSHEFLNNTVQHFTNKQPAVLPMTTIVQIINAGDFCSTAFLAFFLFCIGGKMVEGRPTLCQWGKRIAAAAFLFYVVHEAYASQPIDASGWIGVLLRGLLAGGMVLGLAWIALTVFAFARTYLLQLPLAKLRSMTQSIRQRRSVQEERSSGTAEDALRRQCQQEEQRRKREQADDVAQARRRRVNARADAALAFSRYASKIGNRFSQDMFDHFVATYMTDDQPADDVEHRGQELLSTLRQHLEEIEPPGKKRTLEELAQWHQEEKAHIEALDTDARTKRIHLATLNTRYADLAAQLMEEIEP